MLFNDVQDSISLVRPEPAVPGELHLLEPHLPRRLRLVDMDVRRLVRLVAVEVEAIAVDAQDGGHIGGLSFAQVFAKSG